MSELVNHPGMWLSDAAAASLARMEADHGVIKIESAARTVAEQQALIDRYDKGGKYNRPPYLYAPRRPASAGLHVSGRAIDTPNTDYMHNIGPEYGWRFNYPYDVVHFEYEIQHDKHINDKTPAPPKPGNDDARKVFASMFSIVPVVPKGNGFYAVRLTDGKRAKITKPEHIDLLRRVKNNDGTDEMLLAELDIVRNILNNAS